MGTPRLVLTCEHATSTVPATWKHLFQGQQGMLNSHRGWDPGTLTLGKFLARTFKVELITGQVSRLLIEMNRSLHHPRLFSEFSKDLADDQKWALIDAYWKPYRAHVHKQIEAARVEGRRSVLHVSLHSFTPVLAGEVRAAELGLLFDPARAEEARFARDWQVLLRELLPGFRVRRNYPYRGVADGLTTGLRREYGDSAYAGIELEINQKLVAGSGWLAIQRAVANSLKQLLSETLTPKEVRPLKDREGQTPLGIGSLPSSQGQPEDIR